jgi:ferrous iron transport protein A
MKQEEMDQPAVPDVTLESAPIGSRVRITAIQGGRGLHRRLMGLGLRVGSEVEVLHHRGSGVVVASAGNRIALGGGVSEKLLIERLPNDTDS